MASMIDPRLSLLCSAAEEMANGRFDVALSDDGTDELARLGRTLAKLGKNLEKRFEEIRMLNHMTQQANAGLILDEVLDNVFETFHSIIPYDRIGLSLLDESGSILRARWARSKATSLRIARNYAAALRGSSLETIIETGRPRILNDLEDYLAAHPASQSTRLIVEEGIRSSLTCPLVNVGKPVGFIFFSSMKKHEYDNAHIDLFLQIAGILSAIVEKSHIYQMMAELNAEIMERDEQMKQELSIARTLQDSLRPVEAPRVHGLEIGVTVRPSQEIGGDYHAFESVGAGGGFGVLLADLSGHGIPAALLFAMFHVLFTAERAPGAAPAAILNRLNRKVAKSFPGSSFASTTYARFDVESGMMTLAKASQEPVLVLRANGAVESITDGAPLLGAFDPDLFGELDCRDMAVPVASGDTVLFFTDGLVETENAKGEPLGMEGVLSVLTPDEAPQKLTDRLYRLARRHAGARGLVDDFSAVAVRII